MRWIVWYDPGVPKLIVPIGVPGSCKSTWTREMFPDAIWMSTDVIREELHPGQAYVEELNGEVFRLFHGQIRHNLAMRRDVVADATNLQAEARLKLFEAAADVGIIHYFVFTNVAQAIIRNQQREAVVPPDAMLKMIEKYEKMLREVSLELWVSSTTYISSIS